MRTPALFLGGVVLAAIGCGGDSATCTKDSECKGTLQCIASACVDPSTTPTASPLLTGLPNWTKGSAVASAKPKPAPPPVLLPKATVTATALPTPPPPALRVAECSILPDQPHGADISPAQLKSALANLPDLGCARAADAQRLVKECQTSSGKQRVLVKATGGTASACEIAVRTFSFRVDDGRAGTWVHFSVFVGEGNSFHGESYILELFSDDTSKLEYSGVTGESPACSGKFDGPDGAGNYTSTELRATLRTAPQGLHDYLCTSASSYARVPPLSRCTCGGGPKTWGPCERTGCSKNYHCVEEGADRGYCVCDC